MIDEAAEESGDNLVGGRGDAYCGMLNASYNLKLRSVKAYIPEYPVGDAEDCADMIHDFLPIARTVIGLSDLKIISFGPRPLNFLACNAPIKQLYNLGVEIEEEGAMELARRSRGTPRLANRLLKRVRDFAQVIYDGVITKEVANYALDLLDVDKFGLDHIDRNILITMIEKFQGGPVGLETLAASISEDAGTLEDVYEPYLLKNGFIQRTPRGRVVTELAYQHLGIPREV